MRITRKLYIFSFLLLIVSGCADIKYDLWHSEGSAKPEEKVRINEERHRIAVLVPLSGPASDAGKAIADAAALAIKDTDDRGFDLAIYNTLNTPDAAEKAGKTAVKEGAEVILGPLFGVQAKSVREVARGKNIKVISFSNDKNIAGNGLFIMGLVPEQQVKQILQYAVGHEVVGVSAIVPGGVFGDEVKSSVQKYALQMGMKLRVLAPYNSGESNFQVQAAAIAANFKKHDINLNRQDKTEAIIIPEGGVKLDKIMNALREKGITPKNTLILGTNLWDNYEVNHITGLDGALFTSIPKENFEAFRVNFNKAYGYDPEQIAVLGYDAVRLAIKLSGSKFSNNVITGDSGFGGVNGVFRFLPSGVNERLFEIREVSGGTTSVLVPAERGF